MNEVQARIVEIVRSLLEHTDRSDLEITPDLPLHGEDGLGLDIDDHTLDVLAAREDARADDAP